MKNKNKGFTLIELLVVVLIIGILSAAALPRFQTAIDKTHIIKYVGLSAKIREAQEVYYISNGKYTRDIAELDIDISDLCEGILATKILYNCPSDNVYIDANYSNGAQDGAVRVVFCPGVTNMSSNRTECNNKAILNLYTYFEYGTVSPSKNGKTICSALNNSDRGKRVCKSLKLS